MCLVKIQNTVTVRLGALPQPTSVLHAVATFVWPSILKQKFYKIKQNRNNTKVNVTSHFQVECLVPMRTSANSFEKFVALECKKAVYGHLTTLTG